MAPAQLSIPGGAARDRGLAGADRRGSAGTAELALEVAECARLIKGYGDTHKRGSANFLAIETQVIRPALAGHIPLRRAVDAIASARHRGARRPGRRKPRQCLADVDAQSVPRWRRSKAPVARMERSEMRDSAHADRTGLR